MSAEAYMPPTRSVNRMRSAARDCHGCDLYLDATQTVFSSGPAPAVAMLVGEEPGDIEDRRGKPFVGPGGHLLRRALGEVGIDPDAAYMTNAVKHFRHHYEGKRRIHETPKVSEIRACKPWLEAELAAVKPHLVVALGAVAGQAIAGSSFRVTKVRGQLLDWPSSAPEAGDPPPKLLATVHPASVLRADDRDTAYREFVDDLAVAAQAVP
jgi:DNA polymerase